MVTVVWSDEAARRRLLEEELDRVAALARRLPGLVRAWVFGSVVGGRVHAGSDLDLLVVRETEESPIDRGLTLRRELAPRVPCDLFVYTPAEAAAGGRFFDGVLRNGRALW